MQPLSCYYKNKTRKDGLQGTCKDCRSIYIRNHYSNNINYYKDKAKTRKQSLIKEATEFVLREKDKPCVDCNIKYPHYVMDFDHLKDKKYNISELKHLGYQLDVIKNEIAKCELVCSNCHRIRTWNRRHPEPGSNQQPSV